MQPTASGGRGTPELPAHCGLPAWPPGASVSGTFYFWTQPPGPLARLMELSLIPVPPQSTDPCTPLGTRWRQQVAGEKCTHFILTSTLGGKFHRPYFIGEESGESRVSGRARIQTEISRTLKAVPSPAPRLGVVCQTLRSQNGAREVDPAEISWQAPPHSGIC